MSVRRAVLVLGSIVLLGALSACGTATGSATMATPVAAAPVSTTTVTTTVDGGTVTQTETETETVTDTETVTVTETAPAGGGTDTGGEFVDLGNGISFDWAENDTFECGATQEICWGVLVLAADGCPNGVKVKVYAYPDDGSDSVTTIETSVSAPVPPGEPTLVVVGAKDGGEETASVDSIVCL